MIFPKTSLKPPLGSASSRDPLVIVAMAVCKFFATSLCDLPAANCFKTVTAGTLTYDATSAILIGTDGTVALSAALAASAKVITWEAWG